MCSLFMVFKSLCDSDTKNQEERTNEFPDLEKELDLVRILSLIKKCWCTWAVLMTLIQDTQQGYGSHKPDEPTSRQVPVYPGIQGSVPSYEESV